MPLSRMSNSTYAMPNIIDSHDMGLRTVLQSRRPKINAYSTPIQRKSDEAVLPTVRKKPPDPTESSMDAEHPTTDQEKCESMNRLGDAILLITDRISFLELALARMKTGTSKKTQNDFDHVIIQIEEQKKALEHQTGLLLSIGFCPLTDCLYHSKLNATQILKKNEEEALKLQLLLANSISNVNTNLNSKIVEPKTKKSTRNEGFSSPTKVAKKQKILANYSVGVDAVNVQNKFKALAGSSAMPDSVNAAVPVAPQSPQDPLHPP
ncbi:hypothetical protein TNCV_1713511 [Trichonephila clavipes]|nr:hypothetical protein TNCV_1713511 [Trichonephila clavipes]